MSTNGNEQTNRNNGVKTTELTANGRIRTDNPWFTKPEPENHKSFSDKALTESDQNDLAENLALLTAKYPDLALVVERWPNLPENIKAAITTLVQNER